MIAVQLIHALIWLAVAWSIVAMCGDVVTSIIPQADGRAQEGQGYGRWYIDHYGLIRGLVRQNLLLAAIVTAAGCVATMPGLPPAFIWAGCIPAAFALTKTGAALRNWSFLPGREGHE